MPEVLTDTATHPAPAHRRWGAAVAGLGIAVPETVIANRPIAQRLGVSERWIEGRTGVRERRLAAPGERVVDYATEAGARSLEAAGTAPGDLDLVLVATMTHDQLTPSAAPQVAERIGAHRAGAIDVGAACTGFVSGLALASAMVEAGRASAVLVVGADLMSEVTDPEDRSTAALFADGAGAVVVRACAGPGRVGPTVLGADGSRSDLVVAGREEAVIRMAGHDTFRQAVDRLAQASTAAARAAGRSLEEIDLFAYHQANGRILAAVGERLRLDPSRVIDCIGRYGNTSAATIPLALAEAAEQKKLLPGSLVLIAAFGGGLTWGATVLEWGEPEGEDGDER